MMAMMYVVGGSSNDILNGNDGNDIINGEKLDMM